MLKNANERHPSIKLISELSSSVSFLDVQVNNEQGHLYTSVCHKQAAEPYVVPFKSDHPRHIFDTIIRSALLRALRYSSTLNDFNEERRAIKLMLLCNEYRIH
jgi:hypothetical protein